jgi:magnesium transporter
MMKKESWEQLEELAAAGDAGRLEEYLESLPPSETALALSRLGEDDQFGVLTTLSPVDAADLIEEISDIQAAGMLKALPPDSAAAILDRLESNHQADVLGAMSSEQAEAVISAMPAEDAAEARALIAYAPDVAGGLMSTELLEFSESLTAREVIENLRQQVEQYADYQVQYAYVVSDDGRLVGVLRMRDLLLAPGDRRMGDLMIANPLSVRDDMPLTDLESFFDRHAFVGAPVVDADGTLLGVVHRDDVEAALAERADSDFLKSQGIVGGEELRTMPTLLRSRRRLSWLTINILLNVLAASVIALFQETLQAVIALAVFLPIISDMSGCSGSQAMAVSTRELALGLVRPHELWRVWLKEISVGAINGLVLGGLIAAVGWIWKQNPYLGLVIGTAMALNTMVAVSIGGTVPLVLKGLKQDPALASGPILTTVTDMCGFFLVLGFATLALSLLTGS